MREVSPYTKCIVFTGLYAYSAFRLTFNLTHKHTQVYDVILLRHGYLPTGRLKTRDWKTRDIKVVVNARPVAMERRTNKCSKTEMDVHIEHC